MCRHFIQLFSAIVLVLGLVSLAAADNEGQADLDKATELKVAANDLRDLNQVIDLLDSALEKGLNADNADFAETMLAGTLMQRASALSQALTSQPFQAGPNDRRWRDVRQLALNDLQRVVALDDKQYEAYMHLGRLHSLFEAEAARDALTKVIDAEDDAAAPFQAEAHALRGAVQRNPEERAADFAKAIELDPQKPEYRLLRARHHYTQEAWDEALVDIDEVLKTDDGNFAAHELRALVLLAQDKPQEALESFNRASELAPDAVSPYQYRGELFRQLGDSEKALEQLNKAIELSPDNFLSLAMRSELLLRDEKAEDALKDIDAALKVRPDFIRGHLLRVRILDELDRDDEALAQLEELAKAAPDAPEIQLQLAAYYIDKDYVLKSIEALSRVIDLDSGNTLALRMRGDQYLRVGKHAEALADFEAALAQTSEDEGLLNNFAWTLATSPVDDIRDGKRAVEMATKACELSEYKKPHILSTLAASYAESGDFDKAMEWIQKALQLDQDEFDGEHREDLKKELTSYQEKKPFRELQQLDDEQKKEEEEFFAPPSATPAPGRTIDL